MASTGTAATIVALSACLMLSSACNEKKRSDAPAPPNPGDPSLTARPDASACPEARAVDCADARERIASLEDQRHQALSRRDAAAFARLSLEINQLTELLTLYESGEADTARFAELDAKYKELERLLEADLTSGAESARPSDAADQPADAGHPGTSSEEAAKPELPTYVYHPLETRAVAEVMRDFGGDLYVGESPRNDDGSDSYETLQAPKPWAGYWYPMQSDDLFGKPDSPLGKLDAYLVSLGRAGGAAEAERQQRVGGSDTWEGLCTPWAIASIMTPEPLAPVRLGDKVFDTNDQKALLTKIHERYPTRFYGIRYNGDSATDGTIQDLRPEAFHRVFTTRLAAGKAFVVDSDPSVQVWSKPIYRVRWLVRKDSEKENAFYVVAKPWLVTHRSQISSEPTGDSDRTAPTYEYRLYYDPTTMVDGKYKIIAGEWLNTSIDAHPDSIIIPEDKGEQRSVNGALNDNMDVVRQIVGLN